MSRLTIFAILLIACAPASASAQARPPAPPPCNGRAYMSALSDARWQDALAAAERCYVDADSRPRRGQWAPIDAGMRVVYRYYVAQLLASMGRISEAETMLRNAANEASSSGLGELVPTAQLTAVTAAFVRERSGAAAEARAAYARISPAAAAAHGAAGRAALLALAASDESEARAWGRAGQRERDPTAQFVLGALAEANGDRATARSHYRAAQATLTYLAARNPGAPIRFFERDRIRAALARLPD